MSLINSIFRWILLERMKQVDAFRKSPHEVQAKVLKDNIAKSLNTEWGAEYGYSASMSYEEFRKKVPIQDYNSLKPFIERMMLGEENVLWPGIVNWYAKSSGTTDDKSKFIPISPESLEDSHYKAGKDMYALYYDLYPDGQVADGRSLVLGGSHQIHKMNDKCSYGDLSAVLMQNLPIWAEMKRVPELSIALMDDWEEKAEKMARTTVNKNITNILGVPTWTVLLIRKLFEITGKNDLSEIWPNLELYAHGGVSFAPYRDLFKGLISADKMRYMEIYNASEGFFGIQDERDAQDMLLMLDHGVFYEFLPTDKLGSDNMEAVPLEDVKAGLSYAMVISTNGGLWRYMIGDTVKFTSTSPYHIQITGRTKQYINAFGEELVVENAEKAVSIACEHTGAIVSDYTAGPVFFAGDSNGAHEWLIEFDKEPESMERFTQELDQALQKLNSDYEAKRHKNLALRMPLIHKLEKGTFYDWMKQRGKLGGQNKVPRLSNDRKYLDSIIEMVPGIRTSLRY